jgi:hypothetical protein
MTKAVFEFIRDLTASMLGLYGVPLVLLFGSVEVFGGIGFVYGGIALILYYRFLALFVKEEAGE